MIEAVPQEAATGSVPGTMTVARLPLEGPVAATPKSQTMPAGRDSPQEGHLVFHRDGRIVYAGRHLPTLLRMDSTCLRPGAMVHEVFTPAGAAQPNAHTPWLAWIDGQNPHGSEAELIGSSEFLLSAPGTPDLELALDAFDGRYWLASFRPAASASGIGEALPPVATRDHLTGIANRFLLESVLDGAMASLAGGATEHTTLMFLDLDRFKVVNDTLGHAAGDALLKLVSDRLSHALREGDTLARLGGDEFAILLGSTSSKDSATGLATRIVDLIQRPYLIEGQVVNIGVSIGIAVAPGDGVTRDELLKSADLALYASKSAGRGTFHFFQPAMQERAQQRRSLELDLRKALLLRQFELQYQPQINVETGQVTSFEGLLRWRHPERGLLLPDEFMPLAEDLRLAAPIGEWMLKIACREASRWPDSVTIALNISPLQFEMERFAKSVQSALVASKLPGSRLEIEVSENILLRDERTVLATLEALQRLEVRVVMGGFGTGVASLSQLVNFPFNKIKIDRTLTTSRNNDGKSRAIVRAISALGHSLGISTLAEGVESREHLDYVRAEGCGGVGGFYCSQPLPSSELPEFVAGLFAAKSPTPIQSEGAA